ncbi:MAG: hypothetical protein OCU12_07825 [Methanophagales archaeon]|nr:hypothetical protein [Methanophagales archaeon]
MANRHPHTASTLLLSHHPPPIFHPSFSAPFCPFTRLKPPANLPFVNRFLYFAYNGAMIRQCSATTAKGEPCKAYAMHDSDPPICAVHAKRNKGRGAKPGNQNSRQHGFYGQTYTPEEIADLIAYAEDMTIDDEIAAARVALRRVMQVISTAELPSGTAGYLESLELTANLAPLIFTGTNSIARLLRTKRALDGKSSDGIAAAIAQALDELNTEFGSDF